MLYTTSQFVQKFGGISSRTNILLNPRHSAVWLAAIVKLILEVESFLVIHFYTSVKNARLLFVIEHASECFIILILP